MQIILKSAGNVLISSPVLEIKCSEKKQLRVETGYLVRRSRPHTVHYGKEVTGSSM